MLFAVVGKTHFMLLCPVDTIFHASNKNMS